MPELKSCVFCVNFEHIEGSPCDTCGYDAYNRCAVSDKSQFYKLDDSSQKALCVIAMNCSFFEWHPEIQELRKEVKNEGN